MDITAPGSSQLIRETFILLAVKLLLSQLLIGAVYFSIVDWFQLAGEQINFVRVALFAGLQTLQIGFSLYFFLRWFYHCYEISDKEVVCHRGVLLKNSDYYSLERLESAKLKQTISGLIFNYGNIKLEIHHSDQLDVVILKNISHPRMHIRAIEANLRAHSQNPPTQ